MIWQEPFDGIAVFVKALSSLFLEIVLLQTLIEFTSQTHNWGDSKSHPKIWPCLGTAHAILYDVSIGTSYFRHK
jgi:hypothetical protein